MARKKAAAKSEQPKPIRETAEAVGVAAEAFIAAVSNASAELTLRVAALKASVGATAQPTSEEYEAAHQAKQALGAALHAAKIAIEQAAVEL